MEDKIQEVEQYFRNKLVSGEYKVVERDAHRWQVLIDGKYNFSMWVANGAPSYTISDILTPSYMFFILTEEEREKGWEVIKVQIDKYKEEVFLAQKRQQYEDLKKELNIED